ncbi:MAG: alpha/beta hydrolase [Deltaproteobacteria bacterium]|nr:alpha/beta hydrolase [Deltaproteobacteria bacterium]
MRGGLLNNVVGGIACAALLCATGCGGNGSSIDGGPSQRLVSISATRELVLTCRGRGSPTVVFISGARGAFDDWTHIVSRDGGPPEPSAAAVFGQVAQLTRACAYDRPGTENFDGRPTRSTPVLQPTDAADGVADLYALLSAARVPGPYVLVAHSLGGVIAYLYAAEHAEHVAGLVMVDPGSAFLASTLGAAQWASFVRAARALGDPITTEAHDYERSVAEIGAAPAVVGVPATVLTADMPFDFGAGTEAATWRAWGEAQARLAAQLHARHVTDTDSGHYLAGEQPALVTREIRAIVERSR